MTVSHRALIVVAVLIAISFGLPWSGAVPEAAAQVIQVDSALPDNAAQGTLSLPVTIRGSGFKKGAKAKFYLGGTTNPAGITVSSTRFIDSTQLVATIDVDATATVAGFDIIVQNTDGRTGKGTELFTVAKLVSDELSAEFDDAEAMFRSDGLGPYSWAPNFTGGQVIFNHQYGSIDFQAYQSSSSRTVTLQFTNNVRNAVSLDGMVACRQFDGRPFPHMEAAPPWLGGEGFPAVSYFLVRTEKLAVPPGVNGTSVWTFSGSPFNVRDMPVHDTRIVGVLLSFKDDAGRQFSVRLNQDYWPSTDLQYVSGFVKVTRESEGSWVLEPLGASDPRPVGGLNEANVRMYVPEERKVHAAGYCDLGDWLVPFKITFTSVR